MYGFFGEILPAADPETSTFELLMAEHCGLQSIPSKYPQNLYISEEAAVVTIRVPDITSLLHSTSLAGMSA